MNLQESLLILADLEKDAAELYEKFSRECSKELNPIMVSFSKEEKKHEIIVIDLYKIDDLREKQLNEQTKKAIEKQINYINCNSKTLNLNSQKDFFRYSLQMEKNSIDIYTELFNICEKNAYKHVNFENLIEEERKHMLYIIEKLYKMK